MSSCRTTVSKFWKNAAVVMLSAAVASRYIAIFPVSLDTVTALPLASALWMPSVWNCAVVVWNQVETVTAVSTVKLREDDHWEYAFPPLGSLARTRHQ